MDDRQLMASIAGGDEAALQALLRRFTPLFLYILRPILPDERDREECLADISLRIWQGAGSFDGAKGSLNGWLTALPPPAAGEINPWSMAMTRVLWGLGLITITLNFLYLDVILPAVGGLLLVLGFCTLRRENTPLRWCYILSLASLAVRGACIVLAALPVETGLAPAYVNIALLQVLYVCLWRGMVGVSRAAGEEKPAATAAGAMAVFYAVLTVLALIGVEGWLPVLPMLVLYILLLRSMVRLSRSLADTGYAITAAPVRLPDAAVLWGGLGVLLAAVLLAMFLGQRYPMDWHARDDAPQDETIRQQLLTKGFPSYVLDDLTAEEVSRMAGAVRVYRQVERLYSDTDYRTITTTHYMSDPDRPLVFDRTITDVDGEGERHYTYVYRVYDTLEQTMTHVAVELPEQDGVRRYIYIHHLTYAAPPSPYTEMLELWPAWQTQGDWFPGGHVSGRVLCERNGTAQAAAFHTLKSGSQQVSDLFGTRQTQRITAGWSFPHGVESPRAYVFYDALRGQDGWVIESWANYVCQTAPVYPFRDAAALWHSYGSDAYSLRQTALQVFDG